jgi:hypothetical protein
MLQGKSSGCGVIIRQAGRVRFFVGMPLSELTVFLVPLKLLLVKRWKWFPICAEQLRRYATTSAAPPSLLADPSDPSAVRGAFASAKAGTGQPTVEGRGRPGKTSTRLEMPLARGPSRHKGR